MKQNEKVIWLPLDNKAVCLISYSEDNKDPAKRTDVFKLIVFKEPLEAVNEIVRLQPSNKIIDDFDTLKTKIFELLYSLENEM
jgi:hypothetical protein